MDVFRFKYFAGLKENIVFIEHDIAKVNFMTIFYI